MDSDERWIGAANKGIHGQHLRLDMMDVYRAETGRIVYTITSSTSMTVANTADNSLMAALRAEMPNEEQRMFIDGFHLYLKHA
jgi:hypothetical protein